MFMTSLYSEFLICIKLQINKINYFNPSLSNTAMSILINKKTDPYIGKNLSVFTELIKYYDLLKSNYLFP